jgi:predicted acylesterase/phospholipase RssA
VTVGSREAALNALRKLIDSDEVEAKTLLPDPYLPKGLEPSPDPVRMTPRTLIGGYGNEARYALSAKDPDVIASRPADVLSRRAPISTATEKEYLEKSLDLTMEGGTTSGVVYPLAICELATSFRFRNVGGASAGAIAAALTAAAELGRSSRVLESRGVDQQEGHQQDLAAAPYEGSDPVEQQSERSNTAIRRGFTGLVDIISWLTQTGPEDPEAEEYRLAQLFRPGRAAAPVFRVAVAIMRGRCLRVPLIALAAFGWVTRLITIALLLGAVVLTGWLESRFTGVTHSWPVIIGFGALGLLAFVALVAGLVVVVQRIQFVRRSRRHSAALDKLRAEDDNLLRRLSQPESLSAVPSHRRLVIASAMIVFALVLCFLRPALCGTALLVGLATSVITAVVLLGRVAAYIDGLRSQAFGLVPGATPHRSRSPLDALAGVPKPTVEEALVPWLNGCLNALAGLPNEVLRFGHLWSGLNYHQLRVSPSDDDLRKWKLMSRQKDHRLVNLELMTTDLTRQRPFHFPLEPTERDDDPEQLWVCVDKLRDAESPMFPKPIMKALAEGECRTVRDEHGVQLELHKLPEPRDLPVIFAVRISMSLPVLFQAVRLYRIRQPAAIQDDFGRTLTENGTQVKVPSKDRAQELWFSDGGITSNFPVHFFDNALPRWPTVSLNLGVHPDDAPHQDIWLPQDWEDLNIPAKTLGESGWAFGNAIFNTALSWRDRLQTALPGYRNRTAQVRTRPDEGGTNLFMPREVIAALAVRGAFAGARLRTRFRNKAHWNRFRWLRLRTAMNNLEKLRADTHDRRRFYEEALTGNLWLDRLEQHFCDKPPIGPTKWYEPRPGFWPEAARLVNALADAYGAPDDYEQNVMTHHTPEPYPLFRQVPRL